LPSLGNLLAEIPLSPNLLQHPELLAPAGLLLLVLLALQGLLVKDSY
jgi:hypothetical protein